MKNIFSYKLPEPDLEASFYKQKLLRDKFQLLVIVGLTCGAIAGFIIVDFNMVKESPSLIVSTLGRFATIAVSLPLLFFAYRSKKTKHFHLFAFLLAIVIFSGMIFVNAIRPFDQAIIVVAWDTMAIFSCYAIVPIFLELQIITATYLIIGSSITWLVLKENSWSFFEVISIFGAYLYANVFGIFISRQVNISSRQAFRFLHEERIANAKLRDAMSEIKTLQGIVPICSYCKKVRNDKGYWDQLEKYLVENTEARISHGMCPECLKKERPAVYDRLLKKGKIPLVE